MKMRFAIRPLSAAGAALALTILTVLTVGATQSAHAQTFKSLYSFTGSPTVQRPMPV